MLENTDSNSDDSEAARAIIALRKWVVDNGGIIDDLEIRPDNEFGVRGGFTTRDIMRDAKLIDMPLKLLITSDMGEQTEVRYLEAYQYSSFLCDLFIKKTRMFYCVYMCVYFDVTIINHRSARN